MSLGAGIGGDDLSRNLMMTFKLEPHLMIGVGLPLLPAIKTCNQGFAAFGSRRFGDVERNFIFTTYRKILKYVHNIETVKNPM